MENTIQVRKGLILELIAVAEDYGWNNPALISGFAEMIDYKLSNEEIEIHSRKVEAMDGYSEEDYEDVKGKLQAFKKQYCDV